ncbi:MAG: class I SAM-dependent methyltransferase [Planctomycetota bacterium]|jgi:hypothetical protein
MSAAVFPVLSRLVSTNALPKIKSLLEIGVRDGFMLSHLINENENLDQFLLCDTWGATYGGSNRGNHNHISALLQELGRTTSRITFLDGDSHSLIPAHFCSHPEAVYDVCIIDGDHSGDGLWRDLVNTVDHGNVLIAHDLRHRAHLYLKDVFYGFYETVREEFIAIDDGFDVGMLIRRTLLCS